MKNILHEWRMNRKIRRILAYNKKHPEQCFHFEDFIQGTLSETACSSGSTLTVQDIDKMIAEMFCIPPQLLGEIDSNYNKREVRDV